MPKPSQSEDAPRPWRVRVDGRDAVAVSREPLDLRPTPDGGYSLIAPSGKTHHVAVEALDLRARVMRLRVDGRRHDVALQSPLDQLVDELGLEAESAPVLSEIRAPMPGLVLRITVEAGQEVAAGDTLLVLEAMKMENAIKAPAAGVVAEVHVGQGVAVEKGALLVGF